MSTSEKLSDQAKTAEQRFREAFERLTLGVPEVMPPGTSVSQNNVAKEAGCDPSALRKARFPLLVMEIQEWVRAHGDSCFDSKRQKMRRSRDRNRSYRQTIADFELERDKLAGLLSDANLLIVELTEKVAFLSARLDITRPSAAILDLPEKGN